jgi:hypothetical protein
MWDERFGLGFFEDDDLCVRAQEVGFELVLAQDVYIHHFGSRTIRGLGVDARRQLTVNLERFRDKWGPERTAGFRMIEIGPKSVTTSVPASECSASATRVDSVPLCAPGAPGIPVNAEYMVHEDRSQASSAHTRRARVSLCMIVKNEEANLPDCLGSVADLVDEVIVVDTGSSDGTKQVAERLGARVYEFPWVDSFAAARNESLRHATGDWVLWMDADDRLDEHNRQKLLGLFAGLNGENAGYVLKCRCLPQPGSASATLVDHVRSETIRNFAGNTGCTNRLFPASVPRVGKCGRRRSSSITSATRIRRCGGASRSGTCGFCSLTMQSIPRTRSSCLTSAGTT